MAPKGVCMDIKNGMIAQDVVTGFKGRVMGIIDYWTGCNQVLLRPVTLKDDGSIQDALWFDIERVEIVDSEILELPNLAARLSEGKGGADIPGPIK